LLFAGDIAGDALEPWRSEPDPQPRPEPEPPARPRVLVAEDDPMVSGFIERLLAEQGYVVRTARHGEEALRMALRTSGQFDLVVTDVRMPVMDGWELSRRLQERWPGLPTLYISGYDVELTRGAQRGARQDFLRKPFDADELLRYVARLLGER
jgi:two-component system cell cycle sensor histidine kinase/response regulator CckA